jgi:4-hydroxybenzoate polyprenyltransferase
MAVALRTVIRSARLYFWPIVVLNAGAMAAAVGGDVRRGVCFSLVVCLLASFGYLINDLWDRAVDLVNGARRFANSDRRTIRLGLVAAIACLVAGLGLALLLGPMEVAVGCFLALGLVAYSALLRRYLVAPTVLASVLAAAPLWGPLILWPRNVAPIHWTFVAAMVLVLAARETLKDVRDRVGDAAGARKTVATVFGPGMAKAASAALLVAGAALLGSILIDEALDVTAERRLALAGAGALVLCLVLAPAKAAIAGGGRDGADPAAIRRFVVQSRLAMAVLPLFTFFLPGR